MILRPVAKVNLGLNVVERRPDGYHNLETVFYPVPLCDTLEVRSSCLDKRPVGPSGGGKGVVDVKEVKEGGCHLEVSGVTVEGDVQENLVVRAYKLLKADFPQMAAVEARLHKEIPTQAGMGGGSSDCAYMIRGLNELCHLGLSDEQMIGYAARLGADCPFFILSRPAYAEGIGERLRPVNVELGGLWMAIVRPDIPVPTRDAFRLVKPVRPVKNCLEIVSQPVETWREELVNDFEQSVFALHPEIGAVKERLYELGAVYAAMSGSGSALFGLFSEAPELGNDFEGMFVRVVRL